MVPSFVAALTLRSRLHESADLFDPCNICVVRRMLDQVCLTLVATGKEFGRLCMDLLATAAFC